MLKTTRSFKISALNIIGVDNLEIMIESDLKPNLFISTKKKMTKSKIFI